MAILFGILKRILIFPFILVLSFLNTGMPANAENPKSLQNFSTGASYFPIGIFAVHPDLLYLAKMKGFEVVHYYRFEESSNKDEELSTYLDFAQKLGLKVMVGFDRKNYTVKRVIARVRRFKLHHALWTWYLADEPEKRTREKVSKIAEAISKEDPEHPITIATNDASFATLADFVFAYTYPVIDQPFPRQDLGGYVRRIDQAAKGAEPFIALVQTFNWNHYYSFEKRRKKARNPSVEEMRFMAYYGVTKGCRGVFFFSFQTLPIENDNLDYAVAPLVAQIKTVREYLDGTKISPQQYVDYPYAAAWRKNGKTLVLITNPNKKSIKVRLNSGPWSLVDLESFNVVIRNDILSLDPWGVLILIAKEELNAKG